MAQVAIVLIIPVLTRDRRSPRASTVSLTCPTGERRARRTILLAAPTSPCLDDALVVEVLILESEAAGLAVEKVDSRRSTAVLKA